VSRTADFQDFVATVAQHVAKTLIDPQEAPSSRMSHADGRLFEGLN